MILPICLIIISLTGCTNKNNEDKTKEKFLEEIGYLDTKIVDMLNALDNIILENVEITKKEVKLDDKNAKAEDNTVNSEESEKQKDGQSQNDNSNSDSKEEGKKIDVSGISYVGVLENTDKKIDWSKMKRDIEIVSKFWKIVILDSNKLNQNSQNIYNFSNTLNRSMMAIKDEDKSKTMSELSILYNYLPTFLEEISANEEDIIVKKIKSNVIFAYYYANENDWEKTKQETLKAEQEILELMKKIDIMKAKERKINSIYIGVKELQNSLSTQDIEIFNIYYRYIMEILNSL